MNEFKTAYEKVMSSLFTADDARDLQATKHKKAFAELIEANANVLDPILETIKQAAKESKNTCGLQITIDPTVTNYKTILNILEYLGYKLTDAKTQSEIITLTRYSSSHEFILSINCNW